MVGWFDLQDTKNTQHAGSFLFQHGKKAGTFVLSQQNMKYLRVHWSGTVSTCRALKDATLFRVTFKDLMSITTDDNQIVLHGREGGVVGKNYGEKARFKWTRIEKKKAQSESDEDIPLASKKKKSNESQDGKKESLKNKESLTKKKSTRKKIQKLRTT